MFDRVTVIPGRTVTQFVTREIHEHRAPTDESVRLLREMEAKAEGEVDRRVRLEANGFEAVVDVAEDMVARETLLDCRFLLNGQRHKVRVAIGRQEGPETAAQKLRDTVAVEIAGQIMPAFMVAIGRGWR